MAYKQKKKRKGIASVANVWQREFILEKMKAGHSYQQIALMIKTETGKVITRQRVCQLYQKLTGRKTRPSKPVVQSLEEIQMEQMTTKDLDKLIG